MQNTLSLEPVREKEDAKLLEFLRSQGYWEIRWIEGKGWCGLQDYMFTCGIVIGMTEGKYVGRYCYPDRKEAQRELLAWSGDGDPGGGWVKYKGDGEERLGPGVTN